MAKACLGKGAVAFDGGRSQSKIGDESKNRVQGAESPPDADRVRDPSPGTSLVSCLLLHGDS